MHPSFSRANFALKLCLDIVCLLGCIASVSNAQSSLSSSMDCIQPTSVNLWSNNLTFDGNSTNYTPTFRVGVLAIRGFDAAKEEFDTTFSKYLTLSLGPKFDPPIKFEMVPLDFISLFTYVETKQVDFIYVNPSAFSCIESEYGANSLVSQISRRLVGGQEYHLTKFGGVIFTQANRSDIQSLEDIRDQIVACASISGLGSGQMQFRELAKVGLSYLQDVKQMVFTSNQGRVVHGVLNGDFDIGFVRTDQLERTKDPVSGEFIDKSLLKIINTKNDLQIDGTKFPFESSTPLYAEWNVAALTHVPNEVGKALQTALLQLDDHAFVGGILDECLQRTGCTIASDDDDLESKECYIECVASLDPTDYKRCDTTTELALTAYHAKLQGRYAGWRSTLSYMQLRNMQEETGFISKDLETGSYRCVRSKEIYDAIVCPSGHFRKTLQDVMTGCDQAGLACKDGHQCVCKPCVKAYDIDVFPLYQENGLRVTSSISEEDSSGGCGRFSVCGKVQQRSSITFRAVDNKKREGLHLTIRLWEGDVSRDLTATLVPGTNHTYEFVIPTIGSLVGTKILQIFANGKQIPESPIRLQVDEPNCEEITGSTLTEPDSFGQCICDESSSQIGDKCVAHKILFPSIILPILILTGLGIFLYINKKRKQADSVWSVQPEELCFTDPPEIVGRGTFGLVLLAEYRGTEVAVKRVIPPKSMDKRDSQGTMSTTMAEIDERYSILGKGDSNLSAMEEEINVTSSSNINSESEGSNRKTPKRSASFTRLDSRRASFFDFDSTNSSRHKRRSSFLRSGSSESDENRSSPLTRQGSALGNGGHSRRGSIQSVNSSNNRRGSIQSTSSSNHRRGSIQSTSSSNHRRGSVQSAGSTNVDDPALVMPKTAVGYSTRRSIITPPQVGTSKEGNGDKGVSAPGVTAKSDNNFGMTSGAMMSGTMSGAFGSKSIMNFRATLQNRLAFRSSDDYSILKADFIAEMRHLAKLRHPCITTVMGAVIEKKHEPMLVMEYMNHGSLYDILHNESMMLDGEIILPILRDVAQGIRFLHSAQPQCIHGDLKAQNVLVDDKFRAKVADFGLSQKRRVGATGTPLWMAPELLRGESENTAASDIYSFGIMLYEVYSRKDPYEGENHQHVLQLVMDPKVNKRPPIPMGCPTQIMNLMTDCVHPKPEQRLSSSELDLRLKRFEVKSVEPGYKDFSFRSRAQRSKHTSKALRNEELLSEVFPKHIAEALRDGRKVEPDSRDCVTVFFSQLIDFEALCSTMDVVKVTDLLDRLYGKIDELASKHGVFKIETIGDIYMSVTNLAEEQDEDHVKRMAQFAIDVLNVASSDTLIDEDDPSRGFAPVRIGFHTGPIIANVVGTRTPKYTIFGDTVNVASRMESNSECNRIQCSDRSASLLQQQWPEVKLNPRGPLYIKGKGSMETFWVNEDGSNMDGDNGGEQQNAISENIL